MHDILILASREALFLVLITAMGIGPTSFLPSSFSRTSRIAFTPVFGLSAAVCLFTTIEWYIDGNQAQWIVIPIALLSTAVGVCRYRAIKRRATAGLDETSSARDHRALLRIAIQILLVCVAISLPAAAMLASQHSIGPTAYEVYDSPGYVATADGAQVLSIGDADHTKLPVDNFVIAHWVNQVETNNRLDFTPFSAAVNALSGLHGTQTWAAYLLAVLVAGGLGLYGAICVSSKTESWFAVVGGGLVGGAFYLQLLMDGSQAAIAGLALVVPLLLLIRENVKRPSVAIMSLTALLLAGLTSVYPIFFLAIVASAIVYLVASTSASSHWRWQKLWPALLRGFGYIIATFLVSSALDLVAAIRNVPEWISLLGGGGGSASQPQYHLGFAVVSSWLLQVRDFYTTAFGPQSPFFDVLPALVIPLIALVILLCGLRRVRAVWIPLLFILISALTATKQVAIDSCAYCEDRSLLPVVPVALFAIFTTISIIVANQTTRQRLINVIGMAAYLSFVGLSLTNEQSRFKGNGIFLPDAIANAIHVIPPTHQPVELEGFGVAQFPAVLAEEALPYEELLEAVPSGVSFLPGEPGHGVNASFGPPRAVRENSFDPTYQYVITRIPQVLTGRKLLVESEGVALEKRSSPLDVTIESGINSAVDPSPNGSVAGWVNGPLSFVVTGKHAAHEHVSLVFVLPSTSVSIPRNSRIHLQQSGVYVKACLPVEQSSRQTTVTIVSIPANVGIVLHAMSASYGSCV